MDAFVVRIPRESHKTNQHKQQFHCRYCHKKFKERIDLQSHLNIHTNKKLNSPTNHDDDDDDDDESTLYSNYSEKSEFDSDSNVTYSPSNHSEEELSEINSINTEEILSEINELNQNSLKNNNKNKNKNKRKRNNNNDDKMNMNEYIDDINDLSHFVVSGDDENYKKYKKSVEKEKKKEYNLLSQSIPYNQPSAKKRKFSNDNNIFIDLTNDDNGDNDDNHDDNIRITDGYFDDNNVSDHILDDVPFELTGSLNDMFTDNDDNQENERSLNRQSSAEWKELLNGDPNHSKPIINKKKRKSKESKENNMCSTCHTYPVGQETNGQCISCRDNKLGMPFCINCDIRLSHQDCQKWIKQCQYTDITDISQFVLCQTCFVSLEEEFL